MWRWFTYEEEKEEESDMETRMEKSGNGERTRVVGARSPTSTPGRGRGARRSDRGMAPTYDELDPAVTAAILTQVSFRDWVGVGTAAVVTAGCCCWCGVIG